MRLLAIDPGMNNGWAILDEDGRLVASGEIPTIGEKNSKRLAVAGMKDLVSIHRVTRAVMEAASAMPRQGVSSMFRYGRACGQLEGSLMALGIPLEFAAPAAWKRAYGAGKSKDNMRALAVEQWPDKHALFTRVKDQHVAEAAMLGLWFLRRLNGEKQR